MNKSYLDDEETLNEMNEVKNMSVEEILNDTSEQYESFNYFDSKIDVLEFERDFAIVSERLIDHSLSQEDAERKAIVAMREYYTEIDGSIKDSEVDAWLKEQENKLQIGSCYSDEEDFRAEYDAYRNTCPEGDTQDYDDHGYDIPELWDFEEGRI